MRTIPVGQINGRPFLFVVGIGFYAEAVRYFETEWTRQMGQFGLVGPVARALLSHHGSRLCITTNLGTETSEWIIVTRVQHYAGGLLLSRDAGVTQTQFHVVRFGGHGRFARLRQLCALACGLIRYDPDVTIEATDWVHVEGDESTPIQVDGEMLGTLPVDISLHSERLSLIFPSNHCSQFRSSLPRKASVV